MADERQSERPAVTEPIGRRRALGLLGSGALGLLGGCFGAKDLFERSDPGEQLSVAIKSPPADADTRALRIARFLATNLTAVGINATVVPTRRETLMRDVLVNQQFDVYVAPFPECDDPDFLRPLFHSRYTDTAGWYNPFGFEDGDVDSLLELQRRQDGGQRRRTLGTIQEKLARAQPLSVLAFVDELRALSSTVGVGYGADGIHSKLGYLTLSSATLDTVPDPTAGQTNGTAETRTAAPSETRSPADGIRMTLTDNRALKNLNPLSAAARDDGVVTSLLYDSLGQRIDGRVRPWLADSWTWSDESPVEVSLDLSIREGATWHDGTDVDATDVAFTYRFLSDTSMGAFDSPVPAPRFSGRASLLDAVETLDSNTVRLTFDSVSRPVARQALTVPILPAHVWESKTGKALVGSIDTEETLTEAVVWANRNPVGSGPLRFRRLQPQERLVLEPFADHFLTDVTAPHLKPFADGVDYDALTFRRAPSSEAAISLVQNGDAEGTGLGVAPSSIPTIGRDSSLDLSVTPTRTFYHVGYNTRRPPFDDPAFRRLVARLLDKAYFAEEVFEGYGKPAASPLARHDSLASQLAWDGRDPVAPFFGEDGRLDTDRAREAFRNAGYRYTAEGELVVS
ncbi:ABC transporter substrate-binding protein [Halomicroarcula sp. F13]|uniref:ABC transporter substrate-binding protein n=1 Tax=Haloarcula rubra TaxID=2487747 RepID=A0AAW4PST7_9EURY|nr:ABC transporter substrate-binding protein [Halomicroarcula rubra]MBX0324326.1 ABC transporter substrate-binding protein [Halomicroarcula rubra]